MDFTTLTQQEITTLLRLEMEEAWRESKAPEEVVSLIATQLSTLSDVIRHGALKESICLLNNETFSSSYLELLVEAITINPILSHKDFFYIYYGLNQGKNLTKAGEILDMIALTFPGEDLTEKYKLSKLNHYLNSGYETHRLVIQQIKVDLSL